MYIVYVCDTTPRNTPEDPRARSRHWGTLGDPRRTTRGPTEPLKTRGLGCPKGFSMTRDQAPVEALWCCCGTSVLRLDNVFVHEQKQSKAGENHCDQLRILYLHHHHCCYRFCFVEVFQKTDKFQQLNHPVNEQNMLCSTTWIHSLLRHAAAIKPLCYGFALRPRACEKINMVYVQGQRMRHEKEGCFQDTTCD